MKKDGDFEGGRGARFYFAGRKAAGIEREEGLL